MRIRTIKPEFWTHPVMIRMNDSAKLLALALLNYADDEGYFYADEDMIRGALFPKKESTTIRRAIDELSSIDYIEVSDHPTHGPIGRVVNFSEHQRVDRAKPSTIRYLHSSKDRRTFDGQSTEEGKGMEGNGREGNSAAETATRPTESSDSADSKPSTPPPPRTTKRAEQIEAIYQAYPLKTGKQIALKAIAKRIAAGRSPDDLLAAAKEFAKFHDMADPDKRDFTPHPSTWFNQGRDEDPPEAMARHFKLDPRNLPKTANSPPPITEPTGWLDALLAKYPTFDSSLRWDQLTPAIRQEVRRLLDDQK